MKKLSLAIIGVAIICLVLWRIDIGVTVALIKGFSPVYLAIAIALQIMTTYLIGVQWQRMGHIMGKGLSLYQLIRMNLLGSFMEGITPAAKSGGEALKAVILKREMGLNYPDAIALITSQKIVSLISFVGITTVFITLYIARQGLSSDQSRLAIIGVVSMIGIIISFIYFALRLCKATKFTNKLPISLERKDKINNFLLKLHKSLSDIAKSRPKLALELLIAVGIWLIYPIKAYIIARGFSLDLSFIEVAMITNFAYTLGMLPLSPGGVGTFEGGMVFFMIPFGIDADLGMAAALMVRFVTFWLVFIGSGGWMLLEKSCQYVRNAFSSS